MSAPKVGDRVRLVTARFPDIDGRIGTVTGVLPLSEVCRVDFPSAGSWADDLLARDGRRSALFEFDEVVPAPEEDDGTEAESLAEVEPPRTPAPFPDVAVHGRAPEPRWSHAGLMSVIAS